MAEPIYKTLRLKDGRWGVGYWDYGSTSRTGVRQIVKTFCFEPSARAFAEAMNADVESAGREELQGVADFMRLQGWQ